MSAASQPSRIGAALWLFIIFGSILAISWYAWSVLNREPSSASTSTKTTEDGDPNTFNIDEQLDMLNE